MNILDRYWICDAGHWTVYYTTNEVAVALVERGYYCRCTRRYCFVYDTLQEQIVGENTPKKMPDANFRQFSLAILNGGSI